MKDLFIDLETYSPVPLKKSGTYPYAESDAFEILLFGYSVDGAPVQVVDLACGEKVPEDILTALTDNTVTKWAFNAAFERVCLSYWLKKHYPEYSRHTAFQRTQFAIILTQPAGAATWYGRPMSACRFPWKAPARFSDWRTRNYLRAKT